MPVLPVAATMMRGAPWPALAGVVVVLVVAVLLVFHGAYHLYFAQDDFRGLAVAAGIYPAHTDLWRYISIRSFMDVLHPWFGADPEPYHVVSFLLHAANSVMLFVLLASRLHLAAAAIGAIFFAVHPAHFTALYWLSARADLLAGSSVSRPSR